MITDGIDAKIFRPIMLNNLGFKLLKTKICSQVVCDWRCLASGKPLKNVLCIAVRLENLP